MDKLFRLIEREVEAQVAERVAEAERRASERMTVALEHISKTYDISLRQLMRDVSLEDEVTECQCLGLTKTKKRCRWAGKYDGYCEKHKDQKPVPVLRSSASASCVTQEHTHTLPPMFLAGCPVCDESARRRSMICV